MNNINSNFYKRCIWLAVLALLLNPGFAQIAGWQFGSPAAAGNEATYAATTLDADLAPGTTLSRGSGISPTQLARGFSSNNWTAATKSAAVASDQYLEFSIQATPGHAVSLSSIDARMRRTSTGPNAYIWTYSLDGATFTDIGSAVSFTSTSDGVTQATINLSTVTALQGVAYGTQITFRLYAWGAQNTTGTFALGRFAAGNTSNSLEIGGTVTATGTNNTSVAFATTASTASEASGTVNLALHITGASSTNATTATIAATGATGRITGYSTTVTFPAGSSAPAEVVVQLNDDATCNGDEDITFEITGISGGDGSPFIGTNNTHVLTITDDEQPLDPTATAATSVGSNGFTANWDPVSGATGYFLDVSESPTFGGPGGTVVGWDFDDSDDVADSGTPQNAAQVITTNAAGNITYSAGATGNAISADDGMAVPAQNIGRWNSMRPACSASRFHPRSAAPIAGLGNSSSNTSSAVQGLGPMCPAEARCWPIISPLA